MPTVLQLGKFKLTSPKVVVCDPGYDEQTAGMGGLGCLVSPCAIGDWGVELTLDTAPSYGWEMPRTVIAARADFSVLPDSPDWQRVDEVGGDCGMLGAYDLAHFHDVGVIPPGQRWTFDGGPADPDDLWYSFICEAIAQRDATVIPNGFVVHWDGGMDVDTFSSGSRVVAIRLSISGWPDRV
jgi:hypothetical protein